MRACVNIDVGVLVGQTLYKTLKSECVLGTPGRSREGPHSFTHVFILMKFAFVAATLISCRYVNVEGAAFDEF